MSERNKPKKRLADYKAMSTPALEALLRQDLQENLLDAEAISIVSHILKERMEQEDPDSIPPIDLQWKSFRENYLSFKAQLRRFARRVLPKILIVLGVLAAIAVFIWVENRPLRTESLADIVTLEDGRFAVDGFQAGTPQDDVVAWLEEQDLPYSGSDLDYYLNLYHGDRFTSAVIPKRYPNGASWVSIQGNMRIEELGKINVRCTYYFNDGLLTYVDLEAEPVRGKIRNAVRDFRQMALAAESAYGSAQNLGGDVWVPYDFSRPGEDRLLWYGAEGSSLEIFGHYFQQPGGIARIFSKDPKAGKLIDIFEVRIRITL